MKNIMEFGAFFSQVYLNEVTWNKEITSEKQFANALSKSFIYFNDFVKLFQNACGRAENARFFGEKIEISEICRWDEMFDSYLSESLDNGTFKMNDYLMLSDVLDLYLPGTVMKLTNTPPMVFQDFGDVKLSEIREVLKSAVANKKPPKVN